MILRHRFGADQPAGVPTWRHAARRLAHAVGTAEGRRHVRRIAGDTRDRVAGAVFRWRPLRPIGRAIHRRVRESARRRPDSVHTFFVRNPPLFEQIGLVLAGWPAERALRVASIGCSTGAELYSVLWLIRSRRPDVQASGVGVDIDPTVLAKAARGAYRRDDLELSLISDELVDQLFVPHGAELLVEGWIAGGTEWRQGDVAADDLAGALGQFDLVLANNLLCHLPEDAAEAGMRNVVRLVAPGGCLVCYGVDLDIRERVIAESGLAPFPHDVELSYTAEPRALWKWPFAYWAQEPFDETRADATLRYSSIFVTMAGIL